MVADIDHARSTVHVCTYIWLDDTNGLKMKEALTWSIVWVALSLCFNWWIYHEFGKQFFVKAADPTSPRGPAT